jgi:peroxiredoxin
VLSQIVLIIALIMSGNLSNNPIGKKAVEFSLPSVAGEKTALENFRGQVVLLNFWATWCVPCREELPELVRLQEKFRKRGLVVVAVSVDHELENVRSFLKKYDIKLQALWDHKQKVVEAYAVDRMPSSYLIDRGGILRFVHRGYSAEELKRIESEIDELLDKP